MISISRNLSAGIHSPFCLGLANTGVEKKCCCIWRFHSHSYPEREYARFLPLYDSSLWHEYVAELRFCLAQISEFKCEAAEVIVAGWSQGAWFSYLRCSSACGQNCGPGSCATFSDLLALGKTNVHGFFYYRVGLLVFDLEDVVSVASLGTQVNILFGEDDRGCFYQVYKK